VLKRTEWSAEDRYLVVVSDLFTMTAGLEVVTLSGDAG
jgi:hypothetical protein